MKQEQKVLPEFEYILNNIREITNNVAEAKDKYRAKDDVVEIMAVTKSVEPEKVNFAVSQGITLLGENRVQEFLSKKDSYDPSAKVHMIGHMQTNKVKYIINEVEMIQSVDSFKLAGEINKLAMKNNRIMNVLLEVNIGEELSKSGVSSSALTELAKQVSELQNIRVKGLMAIPPVGADESTFARMKELFEGLRSADIPNITMDTLSMGMSGDYELAIKHGSNLVRIGTKLFGARKYLEV